MDSVERWSAAEGFAYRRLGDELFDVLDAALLAKTREQLVVATDLARLHWMQCLLRDYQAVLWLDADSLILGGCEFHLPDTDFAVGRETWVQAHDGRPRLYRKVHNAALFARRGGVELPFYLRTARHLLSQYAHTHMPAQFIGPKLLTALHNIAGFDVLEQANALPPLVARDLLNEGGRYLDAYRLALTQQPFVLNLCASSVSGGQFSEGQMLELLGRLQGSDISPLAG